MTSRRHTATHMDRAINEGIFLPSPASGIGPCVNSKLLELGAFQPGSSIGFGG